MKNNENKAKILSGAVILLLFLVVGLFGREDTPAVRPPQSSHAVSAAQSHTASTAQPASADGEAQAASQKDAGAQYTFRSQKLLNSHYEKHGAEFGEITKEEYLALANELIASPAALRKTEKEDGDAVIYDEEDNLFLILSTDGYIRTFFRPDDGIRYYERQ